MTGQFSTFYNKTTDLWTAVLHIIHGKYIIVTKQGQFLCGCTFNCFLACHQVHILITRKGKLYTGTSADITLQVLNT